ncbi:hypothetical protein PUN28_011821 [Cardiocondyla obscurior]|uniref:Uncharacterized protein n=1 Tax=Cardiocondyla obscurior TaxID=286306 RepID=A0AAW2FLA5_9HYME
MILLFLIWPQMRCTENSNLKNEEVFDQLATASETVVHAAKPNDNSKDLEEQPSSVSSSVDATVHYENSNGFVPIVPSALSSVTYDESDYEQQTYEDNNSTIADERLNEFELLKVTNDTPAVANYQEFYENVRGTVNPVANTEPNKSSSRRPNDERGKRLENHSRNYGWQSQRSNDKDIYAQFYSYNNAQDTKKTTYGQEKVADNYQQQSTANYNALSVAKQNVATPPSSSRTNYEANELAHSGTRGDAAGSSRTRHRFMKPVVVAEPSNHKLDVKFNDQSHNTESDDDEKILKNVELSGSETSNYHSAYNNNSRQRSYHRTEEDSRDLSDESTDYDYLDRSRLKAQKNRRRLPYQDSSKKLPKEHRGTLNESAEENKYTYNSSRLKSLRHKMKANPWLNDPSAIQNDESVEDIRHDSRRGSTKTKSTNVQHGTNINTWNQISPSLEISHSNGIELDQLEKPKYVVNLVPVANFDHATALGASQGFDMSNAMLQNLATVAPIGSFSTTTPLLSTPQSVLAQNLAIAKNLVSTPVPDIIVGQNTFQNPMHTILLSQPGGHNKIADTLRANYIPSTMSPVVAITPSLTPTLQSMSVNGIQSNVTPRTTFAVMPQATIQTYPNFLQTPLQATHFQVNTHGLQGQNLINPGTLQVQSMPTMSTILSSQTMPEGRANLASTDLHGKKNTYSNSGTNFLATASLAVGQKQAVNPYYVQNQNPQVTKGGRLTLQTVDSATSHSVNNVNTATGNAHLPNVGSKNVEIVNPNMKLHSLTHSYNYPTTVLTTPIPIFSTIASVNPQTAVNLQNYVNSLTESGTKNKQIDFKSFQNQERPVFNPINFVPNIDIIKNQNILNNKLPNNELQQGLNLVPAMPGGNFFKPFSSQNELLMKPKLTSDLQKYAEEMFKESLKTMYNSQKWNNDRRPGLQGNFEESDLAKLTTELQNLKSSLSESKFRELLEAHQSENNIFTSDPPKFSGGKKKLEPLIATLEHLLRTHGSVGPIHIYHGEVKSSRKPKFTDSNLAASSNYDFKDNNNNLEFLTPPRPDRFHSKPLRKRPGSRYKNGPRKPRTGGLPIRLNGVDTAASNVEVFLDGTRHRKPSSDFDSENFDYDFRHRSSHDLYKTFTTSKPEILGKILREVKNNKDYDINHPRMHNLLGLLMKNKQLPNRGAQNYFRDKNQLRQFFERDRRRLQQFYSNTLRDYVDRSDTESQSISDVNRNAYSSNSTV